MKKKTNSTKKAKSTKKRISSSKKTAENMKYEIANELGVSLGPDASSRANGSVGGEITRRLVQKGLNKRSNRSK